MGKNTNKYIKAYCKDCKKEWLRRSDTFKTWLGRCRHCAQKHERNKPIVREKQRKMSKLQVLKQGGIPNAVKFTSERMAGSKHPNWNGGPEYRKRPDGRHSTAVRAWRSAIYEQDIFLCQKCFLSYQLVAHHIFSYTKYPELRWDISNGITLCKKHHHEFHHLFGWFDNNKKQIKAFLSCDVSDNSA